MEESPLTTGLLRGQRPQAALAVWEPMACRLRNLPYGRAAEQDAWPLAALAFDRRHSS